MIAIDVRGNSSEPAGRFKRKFDAPANNALLFEERKVAEVLEKLQKLLGKAKEDIIDIAEDMGRSSHPVFFQYEKCTKWSFMQDLGEAATTNRVFSAYAGRM